MKLSFSLAGKISMTISAIGIISIMLVYNIGNSYRQLSYQHHTKAIQQLASVQLKDLIDELKSNSLDLALAIEYEHINGHQQDESANTENMLSRQLDNQFYQYYITAGVIKLLKLYILDTDFTLLSVSTEGIKTDPDSELICPQLGQLAIARRGSEKLQTLASACLYKTYPVYAVIVPFGGLDPDGYIQVITDLAHNLQKLENSLAMPIQIRSLNGQSIFESENWQSSFNNRNFLSIDLPLKNNDGQEIMTISVNIDMTTFNYEAVEYKNRVMTLTIATTLLTLFLVLLILKYSRPS